MFTFFHTYVRAEIISKVIKFIAVYRRVFFAELVVANLVNNCIILWNPRLTVSPPPQELAAGPYAGPVQFVPHPDIQFLCDQLYMFYPAPNFSDWFLPFSYASQNIVRILYAWVRASWIEFNNCPRRCDLFSLLHFCRQLYMFRVLTSVIRSSYNCNYSFWYWLTGSTTIRSRCWFGTDESVPTQQRERMVEDPVNQYQKL